GGRRGLPPHPAQRRHQLGRLPATSILASTGATGCGATTSRPTLPRAATPTWPPNVARHRRCPDSARGARGPEVAARRLKWWPVPLWGTPLGHIAPHPTPRPSGAGAPAYAKGLSPHWLYRYDTPRAKVAELADAQDSGSPALSSSRRLSRASVALSSLRVTLTRPTTLAAGHTEAYQPEDPDFGEIE